MKTALDTNTFKEIRDLIYKESGIFFPDTKKYYLEMKLSQRLKELGLKSFEEYYFYLKYDSGRYREMQKLFEIVTIGETYFFREEPQNEAFKDEILPEIMKRNEREKKIRIWSAGCATGEEPYTIAILVNEKMGNEIKFWDVKILATDINRTALEKAKKGIYKSDSLRFTLDYYKRTYFLRHENGFFEVRPDIRRLVDFKYLNLNDKIAIQLIEKQDVIFCRNVLIYFDLNSKREVVRKFYEKLKPGGYLLLGHAESLHDVTRAFKLVFFKKAFGYKKE